MRLKASFAASGMSVAMLIIAIAGVVILFSLVGAEWAMVMPGISLAVMGLILGILAEIGVNIADSHNSQLPAKELESGSD